MAVMEDKGKVDLVANAESTSSGSLDTPSAYSPPDSHGPRLEPDPQQQSSENTQPEQLQRPGATSRKLSANLLQNIVPLVRSNSDPVINLPSDSTGAQTQSSLINAGMAAMARSNGSSSGRELRDLEELLSKLNPMAEEFVPSSVVGNRGSGNIYAHSLQHDSTSSGDSDGIGHSGIRKKSNYNQGKRRMSRRTSVAQREEVIRRTVYVSDIDQQVTEEQLAALFINCGQVVDCRVCGDPNSVLRFAFIEFTDEEGAAAALALSGTMLGFYPVRVLPSKTAIAPVNPAFLPRSEVEREMCARTVYCTNIDKKVSQADVKLFFESICGEVHRLRLLGDYNHSTRIAFVEFVMAGSAIAALNCSGAVLGSLPIRVSPSKTPVRSRAPRPSSH